jgi:hypothetical protein
MISADCDLIRDDLDAFSDGELRGDDLRRVSEHVSSCRYCTDELHARAAVGESVRGALGISAVAVPAGLASGVVARVRAESALSWRAMLNRAVEDWHWAIVGGGAVSATFASAVFCSALLVFGTAAPQADSLSAIGTRLLESPGVMYAEVAPLGPGQRDLMLVQLATSAEPSEPYPSVFTRDRDDEERLMVNALFDTLARSGGRIDLTSMSAATRKQTEWLLDNIMRLRSGEPAVGPYGALRVYRLHLITNTEVTAKGLTP